MQVLHDVQQKAASQVRVTSTNTTDVKTVTPPKDARACLISVSTTDARVTMNGVDPSSTNGLLIHKDQQPYYLPMGVALRIASTASADSVNDIAWLY